MIEKIDGFWKAIAYEQNGVAWPSEECRRRAWLVLDSEVMVPNSHGIWGEVKYLNEVTPEIAARSLGSLRHLVAGVPGPTSTENHYIYSGGILRFGVSKDGIDTIDLMAYHGPYMEDFLSDSVCRGIFRYDGQQLTLCLANERSKQRPSYFGSTETSDQSVTVYVREHQLENNAVTEIVRAQG